MKNVLKQLFCSHRQTTRFDSMDNGHIDQCTRCHALIEIVEDNGVEETELETALPLPSELKAA